MFNSETGSNSNMIKSGADLPFRYTMDLTSVNPHNTTLWSATTVTSIMQTGNRWEAYKQ